MLIQRVEVVTGGASAVYGSDAVSGVVNFIIDKNFNGFKGVVQGGTSKYGDADSVRVGVANGFNVGERGHFEWSAEYYNRNAIRDQSARPYGDLGAAVVGAGTAANPYELVYGIRQSNTAFGGLVRTGPFAGQQFRPDGTLGPFAVGTPTRSGNISIGGDGGIQTEGYLIPSRRTKQVFARFDYDISDSVHAYIQGRYATADSFTANQSYTNSETAYPLFIYSGNAYLRPEHQAQLTATNTSSFRLNRFNQDLMKDLALDTDVGAGAITAGLQGSLFGDFTWDLYYTHGETRTKLKTINNVSSMNFFAAADAVRDPATGQIVCRVSLTAPGAFPGCAPLNLFGENNASQAAKDFIYQDTAWTAKNGLDDFGAYITGTAFEGPAGPVKVAAGGEYRRADLEVTTTVPSTTFNPQYLRLGELGNSATTSYPGSNLAFFKEAQSAADASQTIAEANVEVNAPILRDMPLVQLLSVNAAARYTKYTNEGNGLGETEFTAKTWKLGAEWQVIDDLRIRATRSRDIRAPTLWDLYQQQIVSSSGISDPLTGVAGQANTVAGGNPDLRPEVAKNTTAGVVYRPGWLPGFSVSLDWYRIKIGNAIGAVNGLNPIIQNLCFASGGTSPYCDLVDRPISYNSTAPGNFPIRVFNLSQNIAKVYAEGVDLEANYTANLEDFHNVGGYLNFRLLWTHQHILKTQSLPNAATTNAAGTSASPQDKVNFTINYVRDRFSATVSQRWASSFTQSANPLQIFNIDDVGSYEQTDVNLSYDFITGDRTLTGFFNVNNLFNNNGDLFQVPGYTGSPGMNYPQGPQADLIGRYVTVGVRFKM
jgi:iron complex outermembrane receptor protein